MFVTINEFSLQQHCMLSLATLPPPTFHVQNYQLTIHCSHHQNIMKLLLSFSVTLLLLSPPSSSSREFLSFLRSGRMASVMTVYLSPDRSCSTSPASVLATRRLATSHSCMALCQKTNSCVAFSLRSKQGGEGESAPQSKV